jgi:DNA-binding CsgD family transcriptional regulator
VHELTRQTLLASLTALRRRNLHLRAAEAIESSGRELTRDNLAALAGHYRLARNAADSQKTVRYCQLAAEAASAVYAWHEAALHYQGALEALTFGRGADPLQRCDLLLDLARVLMTAGEPFRAAEEVAEEAFALAESSRDTKRASLAAQVGIEGWVRHEGEAEIGPAYQKWAQRADRLAAPETRERVWADIALASLIDFTPGDAYELWSRALGLARRLGDPRAFFKAAPNLLAPAGLEPVDLLQRLPLAEQVERHPREGVPTRDLCLGLSLAAGVFLMWGDRNRFNKVRQEALDAAHRTRDPDSLLFTMAHDGMLATLDGRFDDAFTLAQRIRELGETSGNLVAAQQRANQVIRAPLWLTGRAAEAALAFASRPLFAGGGLFTSTRCNYLAKAGRLEEARGLLNAMLQELPLSPEDRRSANVLIHMLITAILLRDKAIVAGVAPRLEVLAPLVHAEGFCPHSPARLLGDSAALLGQNNRAHAYYLEAIEVCERVGFRPEAGIARLHLSELLLKLRPQDKVAANDYLDNAISEFESLGMKPFLEEAAQLRGRFHTSLKPALVYPKGLTAREVEVLGLIAAGRTNPEIASELVISVNTVQNHVRAILSKTGLANRAEAAAYAARTGLA